MPPADPAPAPDSHEPAGRVDVPGAAPEWAVEMARRHFRMTARELAMADKDHDAYRFARALRDAYCRGWRACYDSVTTALSLLHTPPSGGA